MATTLTTATLALKAAVARRARQLRKDGTFPAGTRMAVSSWVVGDMVGIEIRVDVPVIALHNEAAREAGRRLGESCQALRAEFDALFTKHQTPKPFRAAVTINRRDGHLA